jgi:hypothetical protein
VDVDADALVPAPETWFADTPHLPLAERMVREQVHVGPWYVQVFVDREGEPRVVMELSALAHTVAIADGKLADRGVAHEYFRARAAVDPYVVSPEQAVAHLCAATGAKVTEMPSLVRRSGGWAAAMSFWRIALDRPAGVVTTGARWNSAHGRRSVETVIFVGPGLTLNVPAPDQGPVTQIPRLTDGEPGCVDVPLRPGMAQRYDEVVLGG